MVDVGFIKIRGILRLDMDKIFQILAVFVVLLLVISRFIKGREPRYRPYDYIKRFKPPLPADVEARLIPWVDGILDHDAEGLRFSYEAVGRLTIYRREGDRYQQKQELPVPLDCVAMALDPADGKLYFESSGFIFVYG